MLSGFYTIASGMLAQQRNIDLIGNNLVNLETPGYRGQRMVFNTFEHELMTRQEAYQREDIGSASPITLVDDVVTLNHSGLYQNTGHPFDIAIDGPGYFVIQGNEEQPYLTRGGQFNMDAEGYLILEGIGRVMGQDGPIQVKNAQFEVLADGTINNEAGRRIGNLQIQSPAEEVTLVRLNNGMFQMPPGQESQAAEGFRLHQNVKETSNVNYTTEMTAYIEAQRAFQSCSSALQIMDNMNRKAVSQIAAV